MAAKDDPVLVTGGGLGGAAVALALGRKGLPVRVLEQAPEFGVIGYGIQSAECFRCSTDLKRRCGDGQPIMPKAILMIDSVDAMRSYAFRLTRHFVCASSTRIS